MKTKLPFDRPEPLLFGADGEEITTPAESRPVRRKRCVCVHVSLAEEHALHELSLRWYPEKVPDESISARMVITFALANIDVLEPLIFDWSDDCHAKKLAPIPAEHALEARILHHFPTRRPKKGGAR